jgi:hypothetical protein
VGENSFKTLIAYTFKSGSRKEEPTTFVLVKTAHGIQVSELFGPQ